MPGVLPSEKYAGILEYGGTLGGAYFLRRALFMPWELPALMDAGMAAQGVAELDTLARLQASVAGLQSERVAVSALEMQWYMKNQLLRDADWAGMAHSVEIRVPFVDTPLLGRVLETRTLADAIEKRAIAHAVAPRLPATILSRPKTGFAVPIHQWLNPDARASVQSHRDWGRHLYRRFAPS
jgi:asparagine synthase (glutamine-hydrolysing)